MGWRGVTKRAKALSLEGVRVEYLSIFEEVLFRWEGRMGWQVATTFSCSSSVGSARLLTSGCEQDCFSRCFLVCLWAIIIVCLSYSRSHAEDDVEVLVEDLEFFYLLDVVAGEVAVGEVQPLQVLESQQYLGDHLRGDFVGDYAEALELGAVPADGEEAVLGHAGGADEELLDVPEVASDHVAALLPELRLGDVQDAQLVGLLVEALDALEGELVVGDVELLEVEVVEEHLLEAVVGDVVVDEVEDAQALREVLGDAEEQVVVDLAAVQLQVHQVREGPEEAREDGLVDHREVVLEDAHGRVDARAREQHLQLLPGEAVVADVEGSRVGHQFEDEREELVVDVLALEAERLAVGADDAVLDEHLLLELLLLLLGQQLLPLLPLLLLLPRLQLLRQPLDLLLQLRDLDHLVADLLLALEQLVVLHLQHLLGLHDVAFEGDAVEGHLVGGVVALVEGELVVRVELHVVRAVLVALEGDGVVDELERHRHHRPHLRHHPRAQLLGGVAVPLVALPVLDDASLAAGDDLGLVDGLLEHLVGVILDGARLGLLDVPLGLVDDELVALEVVGEFGLDEVLGLGGEGADLVVDGLREGVEVGVDLLDDGLLQELLLDEHLLELVHLVVGVDLGQVRQLVDELRRVDVQVLPPALLADQTLRALRVAAHELAGLLVHLALGVYQRSRHLLYNHTHHTHHQPLHPRSWQQLNARRDEEERNSCKTGLSVSRSEFGLVAIVKAVPSWSSA